MAISRANSLVFIHIPKNGGTAITYSSDISFEKKTPSHLTWQDYKKKMTPLQWDSFFKFSIVRNPWDRVVSNYTYAKMLTSHWHNPRSKHPDYDLCTKLSFIDCVKLLKNEPHRFKHPGWKSQFPYICDINKEIKIDKFFYYHNLDTQDFKKIIPRLSKINVSRKNPEDYLNYYNDESRRLVGEIYHDDIELFGFDFKN